VSFAQRFGTIAGNSFSLVTDDNQSLDLIASPELFVTWYSGIQQILQANYSRLSPRSCTYTALYSW
jgi:hypothetical protein